ncbi:MAG: CDP-alcohol phosphatidyltransferase family protein [Clostridia bacterium]|nr:CDP-alcohol phosphatidyltransferase family protein [Clostridia bacterium]
MNASEKRFWTIPNILSLVRIAMVPLFVWCFFAPIPNNHQWAIVIFLSAGATDVIDGWIARHFNQISLWGRILDPMADKLMVFAALICLMLIDALPLWLVLLYFSKELAQAICSFVLMRRTKDMIASNILGKAGTTFFYITIVTLTLFDPSAALRSILLTLSYVTIVAAFVSYLLQGFRQDQLNHPTSEE